MTEAREGSVPLADLRGRAGFRIVDASGLAGAPVRIEFFIEFEEKAVRYLAVTGDRMRGRPGDFSFVVTFEGQPLEDPRAKAPFLGGVLSVVEVAMDRPWKQPLLLNEFVKLDDVVSRLSPGGEGHLEIICRRTVVLTSDKTVALTAREGMLVQVTLGMMLRRG